MKAKQNTRTKYSKMPEPMLARATRLRQKYPRRRQQKKAWRRFRLRHTDGWCEDDLMDCLTAELEAGAYIKPDVTLGRPVRTEVEVYAERRARQARSHARDGYTP